MSGALTGKVGGALCTQRQPRTAARRRPIFSIITNHAALGRPWWVCYSFRQMTIDEITGGSTDAPRPSPGARVSASRAKMNSTVPRFFKVSSLRRLAKKKTLSRLIEPPRSGDIDRTAFCYAARGRFAFSGKAIIVKVGLTVWRRCRHLIAYRDVFALQSSWRCPGGRGVTSRPLSGADMRTARRPRVRATTSPAFLDVTATWQGTISANLERLILYMNPPLCWQSAPLLFRPRSPASNCIARS